MIACQAAVIRLDAELAHQPLEIAEAPAIQQAEIAETTATQQGVIAIITAAIQIPNTSFAVGNWGQIFTLGGGIGVKSLLLTFGFNHILPRCCFNVAT